MFYPQGNFYSQGNPGYPQGGFGYSPAGFYPQGGFAQQNFQATPHVIPFANTLYGYPQLTPYFAQSAFAQSAPFAQGLAPSAPFAQSTPFAPSAPFAQSAPQASSWQHLPQLAAQSLALQHPAGFSGLNGIANGTGQPVGLWQQPQSNPEQIHPALPQQPQQQLQRLAQYHYSLAQQFAQLAAQQTAQNPGNPYVGPFIPGTPGQFIQGTGQFIPHQLGTNFMPGNTMH